MSKTNYFSMAKIISNKASLIILLFFTMMLTFISLIEDGRKQSHKSTLQTKSNTFNSKYKVKPLANLPMHFEKNEGQVKDENVKFISRGKGYTLALTSNKTIFSLPNFRKGCNSIIEKTRLKSEAKCEQQRLEINLVGSNPSLQMTGVDELPGISNYFIGKNPEEWITGVKNYSKVRYSKVYDGIDLIFYGNQEKLEYDFMVSQGADPNVISFQLHKEVKTRVDKTGNLLLNVGTNLLTIQKPKAYQEKNGKRISVMSKYVLHDEHTFGFDIGEYDKSETLIIDPVIVYSTLLGISGTGEDVVVDEDGFVYIVGSDGTDAFVTKLHPDSSSLIYKTYLGGQLDDFGNGIAVDTAGYVYVTGETQSDDFPVKNAVQQNFGGELWLDGDAFICKLDPDGKIVYSTYLGGDSEDIGYDIAVDLSGNAYVTGKTISSNFPVVNAYQQSIKIFDYSWGSDVFITKIKFDGSEFVFSTYLGGGFSDIGAGISLDNDNNIYITGFTSSTDFPTTAGAYQTQGRASDAFVTKMNAQGTDLVFSTLLTGGTDPNYSQVVNGLDIAVDYAGNAVIFGSTASPDLPILGAFQTNLGGGTDNFITKFNTDGSRILFSTYLGGSKYEGDFGGIALDSEGNIFVTGQTQSDNFPCEQPIFNNLNGFNDAFVTGISSDGVKLIFSSYLGGSNWDDGHGIFVDQHGNIFITGSTISNDFPQVSPLQSSGSGTFLTKIEFDKGKLAVNPNPIVFPLTLPGETRTETVQLINSGSKPLQLINIDVEPTPLFTLNNIPALPLTLDDGYMVEIDITYSPLSASTAQANYKRNAGAGTLVVLTDAEEPITSVPIKITGIIVNEIGDQSDADIADGQCDIDLDKPGNQCTLRAAIEHVNAWKNVNKIMFSIPGEGVPVIKPNSALPTIIYPVELDGSTQNGGYVVLDGSNAGENVNGLTISAGNSIVKSMDITSFKSTSTAGILLQTSGGNTIDNCVTNGNHYGIKMSGCTNNTIKNSVITYNEKHGILIENSSDNVVENCKIGTDDSGFFPRGNSGAGVLIIYGSNNKLKNNVISGNLLEGVGIYGGAGNLSRNNVIENNKIGTSAAGNKPIANDGSGILLHLAFDTQIKNNIIAGNGIEYNNLRAGITHSFKSKNTIIENNFIGTNSMGDAHLGNGIGIKIASDSAKILFNTISANISNGITLGEFEHVSWNSISFNKIGTDKSGEKELGNGGHGIEVINGSDNELWKNIISGNKKSGIFIGHSSYQNGIYSNNIGTDSTGIKPIGNKEDGITITNSNENRIWNNLISANKNNGISASAFTFDKDNFTKIIISDNKIGTDKNKQNPNNDMGNINEGISIDFITGSIRFNDIGFNKTGLFLYRGVDKYGINNADVIISTNQIYYNKETGLKIFESYPRIINNYIHHNFLGVYIQEKILKSGRLEFKGNNVDDNSGSNSGIHIKNAWVSIEGNSISHDAGNAITVETASDVKVNNNNIFANQGYGLNNLVPLTPIDGQDNWWGDASGPGGSGPGSGDAVSTGVNFSNWHTEIVSLVTSAELDTVIMPSGETDTIAAYFQNWESMLDVVDVQVTDGQGWLQSPASFSVSLDGSMGATARLAFAIPQSTSNGTENKVEIISTSQSNSADVDTATFVIVAQKAEMIAISVSPDSVALAPGDSISFKAIGFDQFYRTVEIIPQWGCTSGVIDSAGFYYAGNETGVFQVTVADVASGLTASAVVNITYSVSINDNFTELPTSLQLFQNYPNPFNPTTKIRFTIPASPVNPTPYQGEKNRENLVTLKVYDILGREVAVLVNEKKSPGIYEVEFAARNLASGVYLYRLNVGNFSVTKKLILLK